MKQIISLVVVVLIVAWLVYDDKEDDAPAGSGASSPALLDGEEAEERLDPKQVAKDLDADCEQMLKEPSHMEARAWCDPKNTNHIGFEMSTKDMLKLANDFYTAGAPNVYVTDIMELGARKTSATMVIQLPRDAGARANVFAAEKKFSESDGATPYEDVGQKYLLLTLD